ncbi:hypothetical protein EJB05_11091, partial [Eragrostis curvula]
MSEHSTMTRRQNSRVVGQVKRRRKQNGSATALHDLSDDLLERILLGVGSPVDLVRAASVCKRWRRVAADAGFLRRICTLHAPPVAAAGSYHNSSLKPRNKSRPLPSFVVSCSSTTTICDRHFSLDFLPDADVMPAVWRAMGSRGSLLLLHGVDRKDPYPTIDYGNMVVCEPVTRRYVRISPATTFQGHDISFAYLCDGDGGIGISNFKLVCLLDRCVGVLGSDGSRRMTRVDGKCMILKDATDANVYCFTGGRTMAAVDRRSANLSYFMLPAIEEWELEGHFDVSLALTSGHADGRDRFVFAHKDGTLKVLLRMDGNGMDELELEQIISASKVKLRDNRKRLHLCTWIRGTPMIVVSQGPRLKKKQMMCFNVDTLEVEDVTGRDDFYGVHYPCKLPWPPVLQACTANEFQ